MSQDQRTHRRQIRNYLLDRKVQLRIALVMVTLTTLATTALGAAWYYEIRNASEVIRINAISVLGTEAANDLQKELAANDRQRLLLLVGFALLLAVLIVGYGIVMTHKLAGPLFKIKRHMGDIEAGRLYKLWGLRRGDQLQEFFSSFESMHAALRQRVEGDMMLLSEVIAAIERGGTLQELVPKLKEQLQVKGDSLRDPSQTTLRIDRPAAAS